MQRGNLKVTPADWNRGESRAIRSQQAIICSLSLAALDHMSPTVAINCTCEDCEDPSHGGSQQKQPDLMMLLRRNVKQVNTVWIDQ